MYGINDVFDYESDIKNPRKGGIEGMREARAFHPTIVLACIVTTLPFIVYLLVIGSWLSNLVLIAVLFSVVAYSIKGLRFKEIPVLDSITSSIHFVGPLVYGVVLAGWNPTAWPWLIAFFLWGMASHAFGAVQDIIPDRKGKLHSIATYFGARTTVWISMALYAAASYIVAKQGSEYVFVALVGLLYCANIAPFLGVTDKSSAATNRGWKRFIWLNLVAGAVVTMTIIFTR